jgi:hypothetical protein
MIANVGKYLRQGNGIRKYSKSALKISFTDAPYQFPRIHMHGTSGVAGWRLLLDALRLPLSDALAVHTLLPFRSLRDEVTLALELA